MADDDDIPKDVTGKTIKLNKLKPNEYRLWVTQTEATFEVHKCLDIVLGEEPNPTPLNEETGEPTGPVGDTLQAKIASWRTHHALAREALLKSLEAPDLLKVIAVKNSAAVIWTRLKNEYGTSLDFEYIRVNAEFQSLRKDKKTLMNDHINKFNTLLQEVEYNTPPEIPPMKKESINLYFLQSLGQD